MKRSADEQTKTAKKDQRPKREVIGKLLSKEEASKVRGGYMITSNGDPNTSDCSHTCGWTWTPFKG